MRLSRLIASFELEPNRAYDDVEITRVRSLDEAETADLSFLTNPKYQRLVEGSKASAVLVGDFVPQAAAVLQLKTEAPYAALGRILEAMFPQQRFEPGRDESAVVAADAQLGSGCHIAAGVVVGAGTRVGPNTVIEANAVIGPGCQLGSDCHIFPGVVLYRGTRLGDRVRIHANSVIGGDGFGYAQVDGRHLKVPQIGCAVIEDDVEIGSQVSIDRGSIKDTRIGRGSKIDNLVQIAHGVQIGEHSMIISQSGIAGSARIGNHTILAGQVGVNGHVQVADHVLVMGKSVVTKDITQAGRYAGNPAEPHIRYQRRLANLRMLDKLKQRLKQLEIQNGEDADD